MKKGIYSQTVLPTTRRRILPFLGALVMIGALGCSLPQARQQVSPADRIAEERRLGDQWAGEIGGLMKRYEDPVLTEKMVKVATKLGAPIPPRISIFSSIHPQYRTPIFVLPGYHWYFSSGALRALKYDNEFAAALAAAQALSERMSTRADTIFSERAEASSTAPRVSVPRFSESEWRTVNLRMVDLLYRAGYDPRGVPRFWQKARSEWGGMSSDWTGVLQDEAYGQISRRAPLMNPVVRSSEFGEIEKRLKKL